MSKLLVAPNNVNDINQLIDIGIDGFILGVDNFSIFNNTSLTMAELKTIVTLIKGRSKEVFISINKMIYNEDIPLLKEYLLVLNELNIDGIMYGDVAVLNLGKKLNITTPLVWINSSLVTNYHACNYWFNQGINGALLSNEITLDEIIEIKKNTKMKIMVMGYGYLPMASSSRHLVTNYFEYIKEEKEEELYKIYEKERNQYYPVYEDKNGTYILSAHILNALEELAALHQNDIEYILLNSLMVERANFINVCKCFVEATLNLDVKDNLKRLSNEVDVYSNYKTDKGFLYKETIYRVKSND